jgi:hypothetical protein
MMVVVFVRLAVIVMGFAVRLVVVFVGLAVVMMVVVFVGLAVMRDMVGLFAQINHGVKATDAAALIGVEVQSPAVYTQLAEFPP